ncbi:restriction endonuclease subunit S [Sorangium sp. So ce204]|uniref:restriction endonuclease subunit S n=1 Tax=Sorangium sp. So ce204 TaxID=3133288 RepID=UPI003F5F306C
MPLAKLDLSKFEQHILKVNDLVITRSGRVGTAAVFTGFQIPVLPGAFLVRFRLHRNVADPFFFRYLFNSPMGRNLIGTIATGSVQQNINITSINSLRVPVPPLAEQRAIASILGSLDDKIELNRLMNETLEAMARALFKSWFVDFDPVRAKMEGRAPAGMDAETAALFPDSFEDAELGPIPRHWAYHSVRDVSEGLYDGPHATPPESDTGAIFLGIPCFTPTSLDLTKARYISEVDWPAWTKRIIPAHRDIVFTYEATLGYFALIPPGLRCCLGRRTALVRPSSDARNNHFLFHWFVSPPFQSFLQAHKQPGSTVDRIWLKDFPEYPVLQPDARLVERFEKFANPIWARIHANQAENATLSALRDTLLPRLLSGELRIKDAEKLAEAAL